MRRLIALPALAALTVLALAGEASAWLTASNSRIDRALYAEHGPREVLAGHVRAHDIAPENGRMDPPPETFEFEVAQTVLGDADRKAARIRFDLRSFEWPEDLLPLAKGTACIVIIDPGADDETDDRLYTILPWSGRALEATDSRERVLRILADELSAQLVTAGTGIDAGPTAASTPTAACRRELALLVAPLLTAERATEVFTPLLDHPDIWLRRAAIGGLALAAPNHENLDRAAADLSAFAESTPADGMVPDIQEGVSYAAYPWFFRAYEWLAMDWSVEERERLRPHIQLHRVVATSYEASEHIHYRFGIQPLCLHGDTTDLRALYEYVNGRETSIDGPLRTRTWTRLPVLRRLAELLELTPIAEAAIAPNGATTGITNEAEQFAAIRAALERRGVDWLE